MDNQVINTFGVKQASTISEETANLLFGNGSPATDPTTIAPIKKKTIETIKKEEDDDDNNDHQINRSPFDVKKTITADDLLNDLKNFDKKEDDDNEPAVITEPALNEPNPLDNQPSQDTTFNDISKELIKLGIFKERDEDSKTPIKSGEEFRDRFLKEKEEAVNEGVYNFLLSKHGDEGIEMFDAVFVKGVPVKDYLSKYNDIKTFESLDMDLEENQKMVFREAYRRQGLAEDKIERKLQRTIDYGDLDEETKDLHEILIKQEREDMNFKVAEAAEKESLKLQQKNEYLNNLSMIFNQKLKDREFDGIPVTEKVARETYDYLSTEKWVLPNGEKLTDFDKDVLELRDPKNHELKVKMALLLKNKLDLSKIKSKVISSKSDQLFETLTRKDSQQRRTTKTAFSPTKSFFDGL